MFVVTEEGPDAAMAPPSLSLDRMPLERLEAEACQMAAGSAAAMYRWLQVVAELERRNVAQEWGMRSTAAWLSWRCALDGRTARDHVRVAMMLLSLPLTSAAMASGRLTYSKARALTRIATPATEARLLCLAEDATVSQLERMIRAYRWSERVRNENAQRQHDERFLDERWDEDGRYTMKSAMAPDEGAIVHAALERACDLLDAEARRKAEPGDAGESGSREPLCLDRGVDRDPARFAKQRADALVLICESFLANEPSPDDDRYQVVVHATVDMLGPPGSLPDENPESRCELDGGVPLAQATLQRLGCDASVLVCIEDRDHNPLYLKRTSYTPNRAQRRALRIRQDGRCGWPGCRSRFRLRAHHVRWWTRDHGPTDIDNLLLLCPFHHRQVHEGGFVIQGDGAQRFRFFRPDGSVIEPAPPLPEARVGGEAQPAGATVAGDVWTGDGDRMDLRACVDALVSIMRG